MVIAIIVNAIALHFNMLTYTIVDSSLAVYNALQYFSFQISRNRVEVVLKTSIRQEAAIFCNRKFFVGKEIIQFSHRIIRWILFKILPELFQ